MVPQLGTIVALLLGVRRLYVVIRPLVKLVGSFLLFMALRLYRMYGLGGNMYFSRVFPYTYLIIPLNIAYAEFLIESFLSVCSFRQTDHVLTTSV